MIDNFSLKFNNFFNEIQIQSKWPKLMDNDCSLINSDFSSFLIQSNDLLIKKKMKSNIDFQILLLISVW